MKFVVLFEDNPNLSSDIRKKHMPEHLKFLTENASKVEAAGPLNHGDGSGAGGIWVVDAADEAAVTQLIDCLLYTSPSPRDGLLSRMPSSA